MSLAKPIPIKCRSALHNVQGGFPYRWDLNIYRGCAHKCRYCFAMYSHKYIGEEDYFGKIFVKENVVEVLERELASAKWKGEVINIGGVTDSYQPAEKERKLMPEILKLMIKYRNPIIISTKSDLILRDFDLIAELARLTYVNIAATITAYDEEVRKLIEPGGAPSAARFAMLKEFSKTEAQRGLHLMPMVPFITDARENVEALFAAARAAKVDYVIPCMMYLRGDTRKSFFEFSKSELPHLHEKFLELYKNRNLFTEHSAKVHKMVDELLHKYNLKRNHGGHDKSEKLKAAGRQMSLFNL